ncbi:hypothetical protein L345_06565, partial [Ophiophagus hannah]
MADNSLSADSMQQQKKLTFQPVKQQANNYTELRYSRCVQMKLQKVIPVKKVASHVTLAIGEPVCKDPPYKVEESGYAGFILPIEVYFKNK